MTPIEFRIPYTGGPRVKGRKHVFNGRPVNDPKQMAAQRKFAAEAFRFRPDRPLEGPVLVKYVFAFAIPKSGANCLRKPGDLRTMKPDVENLVKLANDALNGLIWSDDSLVIPDSWETSRIWDVSAYTYVRVRRASITAA